MKNLKQIGTLFLALWLGMAVAQAGAKDQPDAILRLSHGSFAIGIGYSWGKGTLTYKGKEYAVSVKGLSLGKVGITNATATGDVYNLKSLRDFDGNFTSVGAGATLAGGRSAVTMKNQNNVRVTLGSTTRGVDVTVGGAGVEMKIQK